MNVIPLGHFPRHAKPAVADQSTLPSAYRRGENPAGSMNWLS